MKKLQLLLGITVFLCSFLLYFFTLAPDVMFTDSGELAGACTTFGVAHPTGYPLFVLLGNLFTKLPLGCTPIQSLNLFVAICTAASAFMFMLVTGELLRYLQRISVDTSSQLSTTTIDVVSACTALLYATARTVWSQGTALEVYALHALLLLCVLYLFLKGVLSSNTRFLYASAFVLGLSFTNHLTTILVVPALVFLYFFPPTSPTQHKPSIQSFLIFVAITSSAALLYLVPVLRSSSEAWFNWGEIHRSWDAFTYHVLGKQYRIFMTSKAYAVNSAKFWSLLPYQFAFVGLVGTAFGLVQLVRKAPQLAVFFIVSAISCFAYSMNYNIHDIESYFLLCFIALLLLTSVGFAELVSRKQQLAPLLLVLPIVNVAINYAANDISKHVLVPEYTRLLTHDLPPNSIVISQQWDYFVSAFWYKQQIEGYRNDLIVIDKELLRRTWYTGELLKWYPALASSKAEIDSFMEELQKFESNEPYNPAIIQQRFIAMLNSFITKNYQKHPIYITPEVLQGEEGFATGYNLVQNGLRQRILAPNDTTKVSNPTLDISMFASSANRYYTSIPKKQRGHLEQGICESMFNALGSQAAQLANSGNIPQAIPYIQSILAIDPTHPEALQMMQTLQAK